MSREARIAAVISIVLHFAAVAAIRYPAPQRTGFEGESPTAKNKVFELNMLTAETRREIKREYQPEAPSFENESIEPQINGRLDIDLNELMPPVEIPAPVFQQQDVPVLGSRAVFLRNELSRAPAIDPEADTCNDDDTVMKIPQQEEEEEEEDEAAADVRSAYFAGIMRRIYGAVRYPAGARLRNQQGTACIQFTIGSDGSLLSHAILESSNFDTLDRAAGQSIVRAAPFPPIPAELELQQLTLTVPISFHLEKIR